MSLTLATVETAIEAIQTSGQSFTVDGTTYTQGSLATLVSLRDQLQKASIRTNGTRPLFRGFSFNSAGYEATPADADIVKTVAP